jgi:hypothetical protein
MILIRIYLWNQKIVIPNVVQTEHGFFLDDSPIDVFDISSRDDWTKSLVEKIKKGNAIVPTPDGSEEPGSAILEKLDIVKWSTFERYSVMYTLHLGARYISIYQTGKGEDGMWQSKSSEPRKFDARTPLYQVIDTLVSEIWRNSRIRPPGTGLSVISN